MSPSIFSLPLMNSIGPAALPVTSWRKSPPPIVNVTRAVVGLKALVDLAGAAGDHGLALVAPSSGPPPIRQWITASVSRAASARKCSLHPAEDLAEDLAAHRPRHQLGELLVGRLGHVLASSFASICARIELAALARAASSRRPLGISLRLLTCTPEIAREITSRWISAVPSKMS